MVLGGAEVELVVFELFDGGVKVTFGTGAMFRYSGLNQFVPKLIQDRSIPRHWPMLVQPNNKSTMCKGEVCLPLDPSMTS
jgi:hypothetical protein